MSHGHAQPPAVRSSSSLDRAHRASPSWPFWSLFPLGLGSWLPIYAGVKARVKRWIALGALWSTVTAAGWVWAGLTNGNNAVAGAAIIVGWIGGAATSFLIRGSYLERIASPLHAAIGSARRQLAQRQEAQQLARERPALATAAGIGRPDRPDAYDAGLVDVNNAPLAVLRRLPGVDATLGQRIVHTRREVRGFDSVEDLGGMLDLDAPMVESLREQTVFLPYQPESANPAK